MSVRISFGRCDDGPSVVLSDLLGTKADVAALEHLLRIPRFRAGMPWLIDNRGQGEIPTFREVERLVEFLRQHARAIGPARIALVAGLPGGFAMGRVVEALAAEFPARIRTFRSIVEARDWLHRQPASASAPPVPGLAVASG